MNLNELLLEKMISKLVAMCKKELSLTNLPPIIIVDEPTVGSDHSFGVFENDTIKVVARDRHPVDVMRTLVHELVHWKQRLSGHIMDGTTGSKTENQANALAGSIMRKFGEKYPEFFIL